RQGLAKPIYSPREELGFTTLLPELSGFRRLGRVLAMQQYVALADGRTSEAIGLARVGMRLGQVVQTDTLISGLVGVAISAICIHPLAGHLDQLSARDCEQLYQVCLEWLRMPDPYLHAIEAERSGMRQSLAEVRKKGPEFFIQSLGFDQLDPKDPKAPAYQQAIAEVRRMEQTPQQLDAFLGDVAAQLDRHYERLIAEARKPVWQRENVEFQQDASLAGRCAEFLVPAMTHVSNVYTREQAKVRLLACHAAIRRYRWEHDRLPASLEELSLAELAVDPFTGSMVRYEPRGTRYRLVSAGPVASADNAEAVDGRAPVSVVPGE
ncbi:MAG TPA: hypothetical protein VFU47_14400, partial [Armatimonadota bacterium]|nr:hypothetical protein [Armatimonadota bacterium]